MTSCSGRLVRSLTPRLGGVGCLKIRPSPVRQARGSMPAPLPLMKRSGYRVVVQGVSGNPGPQDESEGASFLMKLSGPVAALVVCALLSGAVLPEEAMAGRSGGRMGGSSFRSRPAMPRGGGRSFRQYNYYGSPGIAPPLVGGYGYGMGGYGLMPSFFFPIGFGGVFNIFIALFVLSSVVNAIKNFQNRDDDRDDFDDF